MKQGKRLLTREGCKNKRKLRKDRVALLIVLIILVTITLFKIIPESEVKEVSTYQYNKEELKQIVKEILDEEKEIKENSEEQENKEIIEETEIVEEIRQENSTTSRGGLQREMKEINSLGNFRITSYYTGDGYESSNKTGSGKTTNNFDIMKIGNKSVYTYQGKIVVAGATEELLKTGYSYRQEGKHYFKYYDTGKLLLDGSWYEFIVLDSCGASMWNGYTRLDIFVPSASDVIDRNSVEVRI